MRTFNNLRIKGKLLSGFGIVIILALFISVVALIELQSVEESYNNVLDGTVSRNIAILNVGRNYARYRRIGATAVVRHGDSEALNKLIREYNSLWAETDKYFDDYFAALSNDISMDEAAKKSRIEKVSALRTIIEEDYNDALQEVFAYSEMDDEESAVAALVKGASLSEGITSQVDELLTSTLNTRVEMTSDAIALAKKAKYILLSVLAVTILAALICAKFISELISNGVRTVIDAARQISAGNFDVEVGSEYHDEIGDLSNSLLHLKQTIKRLASDIKRVHDEFADGDIDTKMDESAYEGEYRVVASGVNEIVAGMTEDMLVAIKAVEEFGKGNFDAYIRQYPGKKAILTDSFTAVRSNLKSFSSDIGSVIKGAAEGNLSVKIDASRYNGGWSNMASGVNDLLDAVVIPIREAISVLDKLSEGNLDVLVEGKYNGEFGTMKSALNNTLTMLSTYIHEIADTLTELSNDNLNQSITREYVGQFSEIKKALNIIIERFNFVIGDIGAAANQVATGAKQISESSNSLAQGASDQAAATQELNATISIINDGTKQNAGNAKDAERLSSDSIANAANGSRYMNDLLNSMHSIKSSSNSISEIIKVIDDIAFQTNLLALNAAVEAARAGEHGKGFAVVAEEVRSLAGRSLNSAKETAELIEEAMHRVNEGTDIANKTAKAFSTIVDNVNSIDGIISEISKASDEQATAISHITAGIAQIAAVVQNNSSTSEETASASEELSGQAELLRNMVSVFKLK